MSKLKPLAEVVSHIPDGALLALGGNGIHRSPAAFARELVRQGKRELELIKTAGGYDVDLLCLAGAVSIVHAGYIGFETLGLAPNFRRSVEQGKVLAAEHACYSVIAGLRAAAYGIPFQPIQGFQGSQLPKVRQFVRIANPYAQGEEEVLLIPALTPDYAILHVHEADELGNGRIIGSQFEDVLMSRAAKRVILTAEKIVPTSVFRAEPEKTQIPGFLVEAVVELPDGAWPGSCQPNYDADYSSIQAYLQLTESDLAHYVKEVI